MLLELFVFAFSVLLGIIPCHMWGKLDGNQGFLLKHPKMKTGCHIIHHYMIGLTLMVLSLILYVQYTSPIWIALLGFSFGICLDDATFHSFSNYFERKKH